MRDKDAKVVVIIGNLSDGFRVVGPFEDLSQAADWATGAESWVMSLEDPSEVKFKPFEV